MQLANWNRKATRKANQIYDKDGMRYQDPDNKGNGVRIDKGDPNHEHASQREDHVVVNHNGKVIGRDGKPINGRIKGNYDTAHAYQLQNIIID